ncbi:RNA polymerase sigma factor [Asticcacaulis machinosus]|uniref:Sigma-70 family RNA polymerase sigma factor n=1 Tax=Asticcacaulis machinosus TaxID=2984211 RepID=A0ABT5HF19_9CAUL|nr:sigma-70 family RNA polymerase sigma factor [Asticcacaulis machinosus]MDC7674588.1 sigma-70 family RNA polymerase sigma factor [Asticcacaulis machinosus]
MSLAPTPTQLRDQSDIDLIGLAVAGSQAAFGELVRRHGAALRTHLRRMGAQGADADDMAQDAFIIAYERLNEFRHEGTLIAWLKTIASRRYLKRLKATQKYLFTDDQSLFETADIRIEAPAIPNLDAALTQLKPLVRVCVTLNFSAGFSHQEIADETGLPLGTVKSHIRRGLDQLRAILSVKASPAPSVSLSVMDADNG